MPSRTRLCETFLRHHGKPFIHQFVQKKLAFIDAKANLKASCWDNPWHPSAASYAIADYIAATGKLRMLATWITLIQADDLGRREGLELLYAGYHFLTEDRRADRAFQPALSFSLDVCERDAKSFVYAGQSTGERRFR